VFVLGSVATSGCASFAGNDCTVLAVCDDGGGVPDVTMTDVYPHDGPLPEGTVPDGFTTDGPCTGDCVNVPSGWQGPLALWEASSGPTPACTGAYTGVSTDVTSGLNAPSAQCSMCSCGGPTGQTCTATVSVYSDYCATLCNTVTVSGTACTNYGPCGTDGSPASNQDSKYSWAVSGGSCVGSGGAPTLPAVSWSTLARTCAYNASTGGACSNGGMCYAPATAPFGGACVEQAGDVMCPTGFATKHLYYSNVTDTRGCTSCSCQAPTGSTCTGGVSYWHNSTCSDYNVTSQISPGVCASSQTYYVDGNSVKGNLGVTGGSCTPQGGQAQGTVTPASPTTVCCQ
jgi:hypothetical protein